MEVVGSIPAWESDFPVVLSTAAKQLACHSSCYGGLRLIFICFGHDGHIPTRPVIENLGQYDCPSSVVSSYVL